MKLTMTRHAEERARCRGITTEEILRVLRYGRRKPTGARWLHYDDRISVVVEWRTLKVVTVMWRYDFMAANWVEGEAQHGNA